jgi:hypothetical protein
MDALTCGYDRRRALTRPFIADVNIIRRRIAALSLSEQIDVATRLASATEGEIVPDPAIESGMWRSEAAIRTRWARKHAASARRLNFQGDSRGAAVHVNVAIQGLINAAIAADAAIPGTLTRAAQIWASSLSD